MISNWMNNLLTFKNYENNLDSSIDTNKMHELKTPGKFNSR